MSNCPLYVICEFNGLMMLFDTWTSSTPPIATPGGGRIVIISIISTWETSLLGQFSSLPKSIFHKYTKNWGGLTWVQHSIQAGWGRCWVAIAVGSTWALVVVWTWTLIEAWVWTTTESWTWPLVETRTLVESSTTRLTPGLILIARPNLIMRSFAHTEMIFMNYCFWITCAPAPWL